MRNKCVIKKINIFFFFDVMENIQVFHSQIGHFEHDHRFLFNREMRNIRSCMDLRQDNICFGIFQVD